MDSTHYQSVNQYLTFYVGYLLVLVAVSAVLWRQTRNQTAQGMFWASLPNARNAPVLLPEKPND